MLKSIAAKAVVPVTLAVTGFVVVFCLLLYSFIRDDLTNSAIEREIHLADLLVKSTHYSMLKDDRESLEHSISYIGNQPGVEHVRIFNKKGLIMFSSAPQEVHNQVNMQAAGCVQCHDGPQPATSLGPMEKARRFTNDRQHDVLAITTPIFNEPNCSNGSCHAHPPEQKVLGTLDIGLSAEPLEAMLGTLRWRMVWFCLMVLILSIGGVCALLRRNILLPIRELVLFAEATVAGDRDQKVPEGNEEVFRLGSSIKEMAEKLHIKSLELDNLQQQRETSETRKT